VTQVKVNEINAGYEIDDPLEYLIFSKYEIDPTKKAQYTATAQIIKELRSTNDIVDGNDKQLEMRIGAILVKAKCEKTTITINGQRVRAWVGVWK
jgi:hypothetical protein